MISRGVTLTKSNIFASWWYCLRTRQIEDSFLIGYSLIRMTARWFCGLYWRTELSIAVNSIAWSRFSQIGMRYSTQKLASLYGALSSLPGKPSHPLMLSSLWGSNPWMWNIDTLGRIFDLDHLFFVRERHTMVSRRENFVVEKCHRTLTLSILKGFF